MNGSRVSQTFQRYQLVIFFVLAYGFTWAYWVQQALVLRGLLDGKVPEFLSIVAGYGPALAAIIVTGIVSGRAGLGQLFRRLVLWRVGIQWYVVALFLPAATALTALGIHLLLGGTTSSAATPPTLEFIPGAPLGQQILIMALIFILGFDGLGEEMGWRGFALPRLLSRYSALTASLILGVFWALWHLPYALTPGSAMSVQPFYTYLPGIIASAILFTWVFNHTKGSLLIAILYHAAGNLTYNVLPDLVPGVYDVGVWGTVVQWMVVVAVVLYTGPAHLSRKTSVVSADSSA